MKPQQFHTIPTSCAILPTVHTTKLLYMHLAYSHPLNEHCTQHCSLHSLLHEGNPYLPCSAAIKFHITYSNVPYKPNLCIPQFLHSRQTISAMLSSYSNYIAAIHNVTRSPCASKCTPHPALCTPLPSTTFLCTQLANTKHSRQNGTRCRDGVKLLWCHSHLVWLVFEGFIPTCTCFTQKTFL